MRGAARRLIAAALATEGARVATLDLHPAVRDAAQGLAGSRHYQGDLTDPRFVAEAMADPEGTARAFGREFGICSCCGRGLEDPVSVFGGIGPVCLERLAGKAARKHLEAAFKASQTINI